MMIRYLVAWGGDARSGDALALGVDLARTFGASLDVVYVLHEESAFGVQHPGERAFRDRVEDQARTKLTAALAAVPDGVDAQVHVRRSTSVTRGILDAVDELGAALLVIGAGAGPGNRFVANPVAGALLHASSVPVAMAPRRYRRAERGPLDELVVAVGTRPGAQLVIDEAVAGASRVGLPMRLISLVDRDGRSRGAAKDEADAARTLLDELRAGLGSGSRPGDAGGGLAGADLDVRVDVGEGRTLKKAISRIDWAPRSALMVGSSRLAQRRQTFLGTTATRLLAHLPVPMIVVPRPE